MEMLFWFEMFVIIFGGVVVIYLICVVGYLMIKWFKIILLCVEVGLNVVSVVVLIILVVLVVVIGGIEMVVVLFVVLVVGLCVFGIMFIVIGWVVVVVIWYFLF